MGFFIGALYSKRDFAAKWEGYEKVGKKGKKGGECSSATLGSE